MGKVVYLFEKDKEKVVKRKPYQISAYDIVKAIKRKFNIKWWEFWRSWRIYVADMYYYPVIPEILEYIRPTKYYEYKEEVFDCDDFSFLKKGYEEDYGYSEQKNFAFGIIWVFSPTKHYGHALNFFIDDKLEMYFYEPQTDTYFKDIKDNWELMLAVV